MSGSDPLLAEPNLADCDGHPHDHDGQTGHGHQYQINHHLNQVVMEVHIHQYKEKRAGATILQHMVGYVNKIVILWK